MNLRAMLAKVVKDGPHKFEYIGTNAENGTLLVATDVTLINRTPAKMRSGITSDAHIAKGMCSFADDTYTLACDSLKPKKDFVKAAIKRELGSFTHKLRVTGHDGVDEEDGVGTPPSPVLRSPTPTPPITSGSTAPPPSPGVSTPSEELIAVRGKLSELLAKLDNDILPRLSGPKSEPFARLRIEVEGAGRATDPVKMAQVYHDVVARIKGLLAPPPRTESPTSRTTTVPPDREDETLAAELRTVIGTYRLPDKARIGVFVDTFNGFAPEFNRIGTVTNVSLRLAQRKELQAKIVKLKSDAEKYVPAITKTEEALQVCQPLFNVARPACFLAEYKRLFAEYQAHDKLRDADACVAEADKVGKGFAALTEQVRTYAAKATEVDRIRETLRVFVTANSIKVLTTAFNTLAEGYRNHLTLTDRTSCLAKIEELLRGFTAVNNSKDQILLDYNKTFELCKELAPVFPGRKKEFLDRLNNAAANRELRELLQELQTLKDEGPAKGSLAMTTVNAKSVTELKRLSVDERIELLTNLRRGEPSTKAERRQALAKLYKCMELEENFKARDKEMRDRVLAGLRTNPTLNEAKKTWDDKSKTQKVAVLKEALKIQCREMGIPESALPAIELFSEPPTVTGPGKTLTRNGYFSPSDGKIYINESHGSFANDFDDALDTIIHENTHNYQHKLVQKLEAGELRPGAPEYNQARLFQLNFGGGGYLDSGDEGTEAYEKQPVEMHAWLAGGEAHRVFVEDAKFKAATLLQTVKLQIKGYPAFRDRLQPIQLALEGALTDTKSGAIEKVVEKAKSDYDLVKLAISRRR